LKRIEVLSNRLMEDMKTLCYETQKELNTRYLFVYYFRLETKYLDLMSRIKQEQEERLRIVDDFQFQVSLKEKAHNEQEKNRVYSLFLSN